MASGHVNRANRPNTWPQPTSRTVKKTLANGEPSTHGTMRTMQTPGIMAAVNARADTRTAVSSSWHCYSFSLVVALVNRSTAATCSECHRNLPRDVLMPRAVSAEAIARSVSTPERMI
jgi:hypothetical protein